MWKWNYALGSAIDASATSGWNAGAGFAPIGPDNVNMFNGVFDGLGHTISGLTINRPDTRYGVGLFGYVYEGALRNVGLSGGSVTGMNLVGGLAGYKVSGAINNVYATGSVTGNNSVGGLVGESYGDIGNAYATGSVIGQNNVGGLAVVFFGRQRNSYYNVDRVSINGGHLLTAGGIFDGQYQAWQAGGRAPLDPAAYLATNAAGEYLLSSPQDIVKAFPFLYGSANKFRLTADIDLAAYPGLYLPALNGQLDGGGHVVRHLDLSGYTSSYVGWVGSLFGFLANLGVVDARVNGYGCVGGLAGANSGTISNAYVTGSVTGQNTVGGLVATNVDDINGGIVRSSFWDIQTTGQATSAGGVGLTTAQMKTQANFTSATAANGNVAPGWDFANIWRIYESQSYPVLRTFQKDLTVTANNAGKTYDGAAWSGGNGVTQSTANALTGAVSYGGSSQGAVNAGTYAIAPSVAMTQQDYQNWHVSYVDGALTIAPAVLGVTIAGSLTGTVQKIYDGTTAATLTSANYLLSGWLGSDGATVTQKVGRYDNANAGSGKAVTVNLTNSDYAAIGGANLSNYVLPSSISGNVGVITKANATVTANSASQTYDGATQSVSGFTTSGLVGGETAAVLTGVVEAGGSGKNAGSYAHTLSGNDGNYNLSFVDGALTITPAVPTPPAAPTITPATPATRDAVAEVSPLRQLKFEEFMQEHVPIAGRNEREFAGTGFRQDLSSEPNARVRIEGDGMRLPPGIASLVP